MTAVLALPAAYLAAALAGSLLPVNRAWSEPQDGTAIFIADNGLHTDIIMPIKAEGLDWSLVFPRNQVPSVQTGARWIAFGSGEQRVYLDTPTWWDIKLRTIWSALAGGKRVMHVELVQSPYYAARQIRLRPEEYRRLWTAIHADFALDPQGAPYRIDHPGYGPSDAFYRATGKANMLHTCNAVVAKWLRLAGVKTSFWPPFDNGLTWRYRRNVD